MKNTIMFIVASLSLLILSCGSKLSITKRHYTKGFYINHSNYNEFKKSKSIKATISQENVVTTGNIKSHEALPVMSPEVQNETQRNETIPNSVKQKKDLTKSKKGKFFMKKVLTPVITRMANGKHESKFTREFKNVKQTKGEVDSLSLFWIVILVLLILWAIGFISSGYLIGSVVNLLLLVALILLILWLLRVV